MKCFNADLLQDDPPEVEPLEVGKCQQGVEGPGHQDEEGQGNTAGDEQLVGLVLLGVGSDVVHKSRVFPAHFGSWRKNVSKTIS